MDFLSNTNIRSFQQYQEQLEQERYRNVTHHLTRDNIAYSFLRECAYFLLTYINELFLIEDIIEKPRLLALLHQHNILCPTRIGDIEDYLNVLVEAKLINYIPRIDAYTGIMDS